MCGRYSLTGPNPGQLRERFALGAELELRQRFNVAPGDDVPTVTTDREGEPRGELLRWGLVPHWAPDPRTGFKMINARAETVAEKPAYRDALARRRCLIVADGFFEWRRPQDGQAKQPFWITRADGAPFAFAGLWASWHPGQPDAIRSCSIVTTAAAQSLADIHPRMPVMLPNPDAEDAWLATAEVDASAARELLVPLDDALLARREVSPAVNDARHDEPDVLDPPPAVEPTLF